MNNYNLLVHYSSEKGYFSARKEIEKTLISLGDKKPIIDKLTDGSVIGVKTILEPKEVISELKEKAILNPSEFLATKKWVPIEYWCAANRNAIETEIKDLRSQINAGERWSIDIETWGRNPNSEELLQLFKNIIPERFVEESGSKTIFVEFQAKEAAISIIKPIDIFVVVEM